ncbi:hypothetical protein CURE108131_23035 [Cupriavidus respiraculi]|uniref:Uncharacterized protein n=1 Tax=Cupriavidus respiraculi TaxID=195930 RepID=A0ABN7YK17_9BURK|nr:hypothetical protein LMG21510_01988 [Cupriavidus respiraculi]
MSRREFYLALAYPLTVLAAIAIVGIAVWATK